MRRIVLLWILCFCVVLNCAAQSLNIGFENGSFDNWQCYAGFVSPGGSVNVSATNPVPTRHTIIGPEGANLKDPYGNFPTLCPNGSKYSIRLGNDSVRAQAEAVSYTLTTPMTGTYTVTFNYAVVLEDPHHLPYEQPRFTATIFDITDGIGISCPAFDFVANSTLPGFQLSHSGNAPDSVFFKPWSTAIIDLTPYRGKQILLTFTTNDCTLGGHFGYAYLDVIDDVNYQAIGGNTYCSSQNSVTLVGPAGFAQYHWLSGKTVIGQGESYTISPPPPDKTVISLEVIPYDPPQCVDTIYTTINKINSNFIFKVQDTISVCAGNTVDLTAPSITAGSDAGLQLSYYTDSLATVYAYYPKAVTPGSYYYIKAYNPEGCSAIGKVYVALGTPVVPINDPIIVTYPAAADLTQAPLKSAGLTFNYFKDTSATIPVAEPTAVTVQGTYYVQIINAMGCRNVLPITVIVKAPPPFVLSAPNTFTPNGDGVNDVFQFSITGYLNFGSVKIFNRNGETVFTTKSITQTWDGTYNGKPLPAGVYYWVFEGTDSYHNIKVNKGGSITIIR